MSSRAVHILAYIEQEGSAPQEYDILLYPDTDASLIFEPFGVRDDQTIAWFTRMVGEWRIGTVYHTDWTFTHIEAGERFIWVKDNLRNLPNIDEYTGGVGRPLWTPEEEDAAIRADLEQAWAAARQTLLSRGLPATPTDIDCYLLDGTPEASDDSCTDTSSDSDDVDFDNADSDDADSDAAWDDARRGEDRDEMGL